MTTMLGRFVERRPFLFHLTARGNLDAIRSFGCLRPAAITLQRAGRNEWLERRRSEHLLVDLEGQPVCIRDQRPLFRGNIELTGHITFEQFVALLNSKVFFWPGTNSGPNDYGRRHFLRYREEECAILKTPTRELLEVNPNSTPLFCRYNSGSPRCSGGRKSPRGPDTFIPAAVFQGAPSEVVEVVFSDEVVLPGSTMVASCELAESLPLFDAPVPST